VLVPPTPVQVTNDSPILVHVSGGPSSWDYVVGFCTIAAVVVGVVAIVLTIHQGQRAQADLVKDRRATFELSVIAEVARLFELNPSHPMPYSGLVRLLPAAEFPSLWEWAVHTKAGQQADRASIRAEINAAIDKRMQQPA